MKIRLSKHLWMNLYACLCISVIYEFFIFYLFANTGFGSSGEDLFGICLFLCIVLFGVLPVCVPLAHWKRLITMKVDGNVMQSFLFGKLKCEVHTDRKVYYVIFESSYLQGVRVWGRYIAISNEPFIYKQSKETKSRMCTATNHEFVDYYDMTKQIIFPYDEKTMHLFEIEKWTNCNL